MFFKINKNIIDQIVTTVSPFLEKKDSSLITSHILLEISENLLIVKATDYEMGITFTTNNIFEQQNGIATVNGQNFINIIKSLKNDFIQIEFNNDTIIISQKNSEFKLPTFDVSKYPVFQDIDTNLINIDTIELIDSFKKILPSVDNANPKYELNGALLQIEEDNINFVSTDTRRLTVVNIPNNQQNETVNLIIPKKIINEIQKLFFDKTQVYHDEHNILIKNDNIQIWSKLINGKYPDYKRVIPTDFKEKVSINKDEFKESLKLITSISNNIQIVFETNKIEFDLLDTTVQSKINIDANNKIKENFTIKANGKHILDILNNTNSAFVEILFNSSKLPFCIKDNNLKAVLMPLTNYK